MRAQVGIIQSALIWVGAFSVGLLLQGPVASAVDKTCNGNFQNCVGTSSKDVLTGGDLPQQFYGQGNDDTIRANGGTDYADGSTGDDTIKGGNATDLLEGAGGNDIVEGEGAGDIYGSPGSYEPALFR